ncbi:MAG: hypothetical protein ACOX7A_03010 [Lawsonibacter sp.]
MAEYSEAVRTSRRSARPPLRSKAAGGRGRALWLKGHFPQESGKAVWDSEKEGKTVEKQLQYFLQIGIIFSRQILPAAPLA